MNLSDIEIIEHDVIVVGAGGAGLRAAIECSKKGLSTGLVCKSLLGKTPYGYGGRWSSCGSWKC